MEEQWIPHLEEALRQALNSFNDLSVLAESGLIVLLGLQGAEDPVAALRVALRQAIDALKPASDTVLYARTARYHEILLQRYVLGCTQRSVAESLSITPRYLRREQAAAIRALAGYLLLRYDLVRDRSARISKVQRGAATDPEINREMLWLAESLRGQTSDLGPVISEAMELVQDLAQRHGVQCAWSQSGLFPPVCVPRTVLKQIILNLLAAVIHELPRGGRVEVASQASADQVTITLTALGESGRTWHLTSSLDDPAAVSRQLIRVFKGDLRLSAVGDVLMVHVLLPCAGRQVLVLAVEDNLDTLQLWQRYTERTCFALVAVTNANQAVADASRLRPDLIVLDIMLPDIDGWELLHALRSEPATASIPVIVCTVLPQRELALSLGAQDFIPKPATGDEFRAVLERQISAAKPSQCRQ